MKIYAKHIKPYLIYFLLSPLMMVVEVYCDVKIPSLSAEIVNLSSMNAEISQILLTTLKMIGYAIVAVSTGVGASYAATKASVNFCHDLREEIFVKIQSFSFNNIDKFSTGSLITRLTNDITQIGQIVVMALRMVFRAPGMLIGAIIMAYTISPSMSMIFIVLTIILSFVIFIVLQISFPRFSKLQEKIDALNVSVGEGLSNIRVIKAFTREKYEKEKFENVNNDLKNTGLRAYKVSISQMPIMTLCVNLTTIAILWFGSKALGKNDLQIGDISALITYLAQILMSVNMIAIVFLQSSRSLVSSKRVLEVLTEEIDVSDKDAKNKDKIVGSGDVTFKNVSFKYFKNSQDYVLENLNVEIKSGQSIGVVGSTGCGKTTFSHLISRLYDVESGEVLVDGVDVRDYSLKNLRDGVAVVLQNNVLFSGSVAENLRYGNEEATQEELEEVANFSASISFIENMQEKYETDLYQGGLNLSGGQKQRLCIARALAKKSKILILDDSTSAVDTATEKKITGHLTNDLSEMTKIIIAQRISSVINCDQIIVMDDGKICDIGVHDKLLESSNVYKEIYDSQMSNGQDCDSMSEEV